ALVAGLALRSGSADELPAAQRAVAKARRSTAFDVWHLDIAAEALQLGARAGDDADELLAPLVAAFDKAGRPPAFALTLGWVRLLVAVARDDAVASAAAARTIADAARSVPEPGDVLASAAKA